MRAHAQVGTHGHDGGTLLLLKLHNRSFAHIEHAAQIDGQLAHELVVVRGLQGTDEGHARAADQLIHAAERLHGLLHHAAGLGSIGQIGLHINGVLVLNVHLRLNAAAYHLGALGQELFRDALADAGAGASNDHNFICKFHFIFLPIRFSQSGCSGARRSSPRSAPRGSARRGVRTSRRTP